jgi:hypothetical protein
MTDPPQCGRRQRPVVSLWVAVCGHEVAIEVALYLWPRRVVTVCKMPCQDLLAVCDVHLSSGRKTRLARWSATSQSPNGLSKRCGGQALRRQPALTLDQRSEITEGRAAGGLRSFQRVPGIEFGVAARDRGGRRRAVVRGSWCRVPASS